MKNRQNSKNKIILYHLIISINNKIMTTMMLELLFVFAHFKLLMLIFAQQMKNGHRDPIFGENFSTLQSFCRGDKYNSQAVMYQRKTGTIKNQFQTFISNKQLPLSKNQRERMSSGIVVIPCLLFDQQ